MRIKNKSLAVRYVSTKDCAENGILHLVLSECDVTMLEEDKRLIQEYKKKKKGTSENSNSVVKRNLCHQKVLWLMQS